MLINAIAILIAWCNVKDIDRPDHLYQDILVLNNTPFIDHIHRYQGKLNMSTIGVMVKYVFLVQKGY